jgi:hypothetical protein
MLRCARLLARIGARSAVIRIHSHASFHGPKVIAQPGETWEGWEQGSGERAHSEPVPGAAKC